MQKYLVLTLAVVSLSPLSGCSKKTESDGARTFGVSYQTLNNAFFIDLTAGIRPAVEAHGDVLEERDAQWNSLKQRNDVSDFVLRGVSAIFINPVNWEGIKGSLLQAKAKGIPCIVVDAPVKDRDLVLATVASDNHKAGSLAAQALVEACRPARIAILHLSPNKACIDRVTGFQEEIAKHADMKVIDIQEGKGTTEGSRPVMSDLLARYQDITADFAVNDPSALGAISALEAADKLSQVKVVSVDGAKAALEAIKSGKLLSTSAQFPAEIGEKAAEIAYLYLEDKPFPTEVTIRVELITLENVDRHLKAAGASD